MAVRRAFLPRLEAGGAYTLIVRAAAFTPIPRSGLVSMEQADLLLMQQVLAAELEGWQRVLALALGPVRTRPADTGDPDQVTADQVGEVAVAALASVAVGGREIRLMGRPDADKALAELATA